MCHTPQGAAFMHILLLTCEEGTLSNMTSSQSPLSLSHSHSGFGSRLCHLPGQALISPFYR